MNIAALRRRLAKLERRFMPPPPILAWREGIDPEPTEEEKAAVAARGGRCISVQYVAPPPRDDD